MFNRIALLLIVLVAVPYYWLFMDAGPQGVAAQTIDLARLRALAASQTGPAPVAIEYAAVATDQEVGTLLVAGGGLKSEETAVFVWRLVTPGGDTVINSGLTEDQALASGYADYHPAIQATVNRWLDGAKRILFTSEEFDHIGGMVAHLPVNPAFAAKVVGNPVQSEAIRALAPSVLQLPVPSHPALAEANAYAALAPGIAAMRTPGHLPGTQMIYVRLADGREFLFAGDSAPMRRNIEWLRPRSRYSAEWQGSEDRAATLAWIKALAALKEREPHLTIVYGHDYGWLKDPAAGPHLVAAAPTAVPESPGRAAR